MKKLFIFLLILNLKLFCNQSEHLSFGDALTLHGDYSNQEHRSHVEAALRGIYGNKQVDSSSAPTVYKEGKLSHITDEFENLLATVDHANTDEALRTQYFIKYAQIETPTLKPSEESAIASPKTTASYTIPKEFKQCGSALFHLFPTEDITFEDDEGDQNNKIIKINNQIVRKINKNGTVSKYEYIKNITKITTINPDGTGTISENGTIIGEIRNNVTFLKKSNDCYEIKMRLLGVDTTYIIKKDRVSISQTGTTTAEGSIYDHNFVQEFGLDKILDGLSYDTSFQEDIKELIKKSKLTFKKRLKISAAKLRDLFKEKKPDSYYVKDDGVHRKKTDVFGNVNITYPNGSKEITYYGPIDKSINTKIKNDYIKKGETATIHLNGDIEIRHLDGDIEIRHLDGDIEIRHLDGDIEIKFSNGQRIFLNTPEKTEIYINNMTKEIATLESDTETLKDDKNKTETKTSIYSQTAEQSKSKKEIFENNYKLICSMNEKIKRLKIVKQELESKKK